MFKVFPVAMVKNSNKNKSQFRLIKPNEQPGKTFEEYLKEALNKS